MVRPARTRAVVLTRPLGQSAAIERLLGEDGYAVVNFPALAIGPAPDQIKLAGALSSLSDFALVVFVSPNAIEFALDALGSPWPGAVAIAVMGPGSRAKLAARGIAAPRYQIYSPSEQGAARFDSEALYAALDINALAGRRCLIVRGDGGRNWLTEALQARQISVDSVAAYQRRIGVPTPDAIEQIDRLIQGQRAAIMTITSSEAIERLLELFERHYGSPGQAWLRAQPLLVSHRRIAENATAHGFDHVHLAEPGDEALLRAIEYLP